MLDSSHGDPSRAGSWSLVRSPLLVLVLMLTWGCAVEAPTASPAFDPLPSKAVLLAGAGNTVLAFDAQSGVQLKSFIQPGSGGLKGLRAMAIGPDHHLYICGDTASGTSAVLRYDGRTGVFMDLFSTHEKLGGCICMAFGPEQRLYVGLSSQEILRLDGATGAFVDVFSTNNGQTGTFTPSALAFGPEGRLYVSTFGDYGSGQVLRLDPSSLQLEILFPPRTFTSDSKREIAVSYRGLLFGPDCASLGDSCELLVGANVVSALRINPAMGVLKNQPGSYFVDDLWTHGELQAFIPGPNGSVYQGYTQQYKNFPVMVSISHWDVRTGSNVPTPDGGTFMSISGFNGPNVPFNAQLLFTFIAP